MPAPSSPWYSGGLRFGCTGCHACCRGVRGGVVYATAAEIERIAAHLAVTPASFRGVHVRKLHGHETIRLTEDGDCSLWKEGCTVYPSRPRQCRTFPFWPEHLRSPAAWEEAALGCEGIGKGDLHSLVQIRGVLRSRGG